MINRAKCKLCNKIIEISNNEGWISCNCGEISINIKDGKKTAIIKHEGSLVEVDDEGNEIILELKDELNPDVSEKPKKDELIKLLDKMIKDIENLPPNAMSTYISQYDMMSALMLVSEIFKSKE